MTEYITEWVSHNIEDPFVREEIVRCRDCAYYDDEPDLTSSTPKCWRDPEHRGAVIWTRPDGFCAWACRKVVDA